MLLKMAIEIVDLSSYKKIFSIDIFYVYIYRERDRWMDRWIDG